MRGKGVALPHAFYHSRFKFYRVMERRSAVIRMRHKEREFPECSARDMLRCETLRVDYEE
jgi:hypothetical protein